jgi:methylamine dehydrogenase accessory protein MauD
MKTSMKGRLTLALFTAIALTGVGSLAGQDSGVGVGDRAPVVRVNDLDGKPVDLGQYIGKKPVLLEFWATWCTNCEQLLPTVRAAHAAYGSEVEFIGVNVAVNQTPEGVRRFLETHKPPYKTLYDNQGTSTRAYEVPATSYVVIVDRSGKIAYTGSGGSQKFDAVLRQVSGK